MSRDVDVFLKSETPIKDICSELENLLGRSASVAVDPTDPDRYIVFSDKALLSIGPNILVNDGDIHFEDYNISIYISIKSSPETSEDDHQECIKFAKWLFDQVAVTDPALATDNGQHVIIQR